MKTIAAATILSFILVGMTRAQTAPKSPDNAPAPPKAEPKLDQAELEKQFEQSMSGATLVGRFSIEGGNRGGEPKEDRYQIVKVTKMRGDYWLFNASMKYGGKEVSAPIVLQVKWAGDTPVITLTDLPIPGMGTYTARVLIYRDHYAGYWSSPNHGGNMWGRIEREKPAERAGGGATTPPQSGADRPASR